MAIWCLLAFLHLSDLVVAQNQSLELRVAKALGSKGYEKVRVSVIAGRQDDAADFPFAYREPLNTDGRRIISLAQ